MKTKITLTIDSDVKNEFQKIAKNMGTNMSTLVNMYFINVINTGRISYYGSNDELGNDLYSEYLMSKNKNKEDSFIVNTNSKNKETVINEINKKLWN